MCLIHKWLKTGAVFEGICSIFRLLFREVVWELPDTK